MKKKKVIKMLSNVVGYAGVDLCKYCKELGVLLPNCDCCTDQECAENIVKMFCKKEELKKYDRENKKNL